MSFFKKKLLDLLKSQLICYFLGYFFAILLTYKKINPIISIVSITILYIYTYLCHIFFSLDIIKDYNPHLIFHHNESYDTYSSYHTITLTMVTDTEDKAKDYIQQNKKGYGYYEYKKIKMNEECYEHICTME